MKKSLFLYLFFLFLLTKAQEENDYPDYDSLGPYYPNPNAGSGYVSDKIYAMFRGICEDNKAKSGACMYKISDYDSKGHTKYSIFDKCGKKEKCSTNDYMCKKNDEEYLKYRKVGESCNYDQDCISDTCKGNKCTAAKENENCDELKCEPELYCSDYFSTEKCVKYAKEGEDGEKTQCLEGLLQDKDKKCVKYGTIAKSKEIECSYDKLMCETGFKHIKKDDSSKCICDTIDTEPTCDENGVSKEGKWTDGAPIQGKCFHIEDYKGTKHHYSEYSKVSSILYEEYLKDYNKLDLEKVNKDGMNWETQEKWYLYEYAVHLKEAGLIDDNGKVVKDKKCEYEFIMKNYLHSYFIKLNTFIIAMIVLLLF